MKAHHFHMGAPICGADYKRAVNAAEQSPPEVTCRRCLRIPPEPGIHYPPRHYARKDGRTFIVEGFAPDPERSWAAEYEGPMS